MQNRFTLLESMNIKYILNIHQLKQKGIVYERFHEKRGNRQNR